MFGDFWQQFGLNFPFFGADAQGGMFAALQSPEPNAQPHQGMQPTHSPSPPGAQAAAAPQPKPAAGASPLASPLAPAALAQAGGLENEIRSNSAKTNHGWTRIDPNSGEVKEFLKNLPPDIEQGDQGGPVLRVKKSPIS